MLKLLFIPFGFAAKAIKGFFSGPNAVEFIVFVTLVLLFVIGLNYKFNI